MPQLFYNFDQWTGGIDAIGLIDQPHLPVWVQGPWSGDGPAALVNNFNFNTDPVAYYVLACILVAIAVIATLRSPWRWLSLLYPVLTTLVVVVTANHFWLDGVVAVAVLAAILAAQSSARRWSADRGDQAAREAVSQGAMDGVRVGIGDGDRLLDHRERGVRADAEH